MEHLSLQDPIPNNGSGRPGATPPSAPPPHQPQGDRFRQHSPPIGPPHPPGGPAPQQPGSIPVLPVQGPPQLPPQLFTTAAQLLDLTDTNLVIQDTIERIYAGNLYGEIPRGVYLVRGENVLLLGEIHLMTFFAPVSLQDSDYFGAVLQDLDREDDIPEPYRLAPFKEVLELKTKEELERKQRDKNHSGKLQTLGFEAEHSGEVLF
ncbi:hypothetical protein PRK78_002510 [Emydomyces testavorans]|uniref:LSM domain-containing protein n=1 Tax=Emydomyces testavorans TaxID=2070801 RepID=A0AAF0DGC9_9EURO|nr:hypothetical protein PRK78_002510 [Emydomyces testavorans]